ncbi:MAG: EpsG family protein [Clostridia bacterium]|nr:EpsG family protein [Clostridia bacterium]
MIFWIMLIWIFAVTYLLQPKICRRTLADDGVYDYKATVGFSVILFIVPLFFIAVRSGFVDTASYIGTFNNAPSDMSRFDEFVNRTDKSFLFYAFIMYFKNYISDNAQWWIAAIAIFQSVLVMYTFRKYSCDMGLSVFLFMASGIVCSWMCNGIRQFIAVAVIFACTQLLIDKKWYFYIPVVLLMMGVLPITTRFGWATPPWYLCGVHQSTLVMLLGCFFIQGKAFSKRVWILAAVFAVLVLTGGLDAALDTSVENTTYVKDMEYVDADTGTSWLRVMVESVPFVMAFVARKELKKEELPPIIALSVNASVITTVLYIASAFTSGIYVGRLPIFTEMYNFILLPWLIKHPYKKYRQQFTIAMILGYLAYFYYQVNIVWADSLYQSELLGINI